MKMKKNYLWMMGLMVMAMFSLTSCDEDEMIGMDVSGHWFGDMDMYINGERARGSEIEFQPMGWGYSYGRGIEVDYYYRGTITHYFDYQIRNGIIYLTFDDPLLDCAIVDYHLNYRYFRGYIADYYSLMNQTYFDLRSYDQYWDTYGYGGYVYYTKENNMEDAWNDSTANDTTHLATRSASDEQPYCIRGVNMKKTGN